MRDNGLKKDLVYAYHLIADLGWDDHTYTHLSVRSEAHPDSFYIFPFGLRFEEATEAGLLRVSLDGQVLENSEFHYNETGYIIHGGLYKSRSDVQAIFHLHTPETIAVSVTAEGLLPVSQWSLIFHQRIGYYAYDSLILDDSLQVSTLAQDLGSHWAMLLRSHGALTCGKSVAETMFYMYYLQKSCETQCIAQSLGEPLVLPSPETCERAAQDMLSFEGTLGARDWEAWKRCIDRKRKQGIFPS